jgi:hypothetical protein
VASLERGREGGHECGAGHGAKLGPGISRTAFTRLDFAALKDLGWTLDFTP